MGAFSYSGDRFRCEQLDVERIADIVGTPLYLYSASTLVQGLRAVREAFAPWSPRVCFSVKANPNLAVLRLLAAHGAGFDVVSGFELERALRVGADARDVVFAGAGKTDAEIERAVRAGVRYINVESGTELAQVDAIAGRLERTADVLIRINPDVEAGGHPGIRTARRTDKFGVDPDEALRLVASPDRFANARIRGFHVHLGSQVRDAEPYARALERVAERIERGRREGADLRVVDIGGGFGCDGAEARLDLGALAAVLRERLDALSCELILEPGRFIAGPSGILVTEVLYVKRRGDRHIVITDAGMTDFLRPALYQARHDILPLQEPLPGSRRFECDVVGPVCESTDVLALGREMPALARGDRLAILDAGAYGSSMASNYNSRPRPAEVLVEGDRYRVIRRRESFDDLVRAEVEIPEHGDGDPPSR